MYFNANDCSYLSEIIVNVNVVPAHRFLSICVVQHIALSLVRQLRLVRYRIDLYYRSIVDGPSTVRY